MQDIMLDIETLGTKPGCVVLSIAAVAFDLVSDEKPKPAVAFSENLSILPQLLKGLQIEGATLTWWRELPDDAKALVVKNPRHPEEVLGEFASWIATLALDRGLKPDDFRIWAKSPEFDCTIVEHLNAVFGGKSLWSYRQKRDVRTIVDVGSRVPSRVPSDVPRTGVHHHALGDCLHQIIEVQTAMKRLNDVSAKI